VWEIEKEQLISMIKVIIKNEEKYMILSLRDKKDEPKPINEH
jgi:hypothetical protein